MSTQGQVAEGIRCLPVLSPTLPPATHTNVWVLGEQHLTVVDPAAVRPDEQARLLHTLGQWGRVERVVLTHHHHDHIGAAALVAEHFGVPVLVHPQTAVRVKLPTQPLGETLSVEAETFHVHHTPGHAPGHIVLQGPRGQVVAGDMVAGLGTIAIDPDDDGHLGTYLASLALLRTLTPTALLPAHGPVLHDADALLADYIAHRHARTAQIREALGRLGPCTPLELARAVYVDLDPRFHPLAAVQIRSHLLWLTEQGLGAPQGDRYGLAASPP